MSQITTTFLLVPGPLFLGLCTMSCEKRGEEIGTLPSDRMWRDHGTLIKAQDNPGHGKSQETQHGEDSGSKGNPTPSGTAAAAISLLLKRCFRNTLPPVTPVPFPEAQNLILDTQQTAGLPP